jgi:hypothetical protein
MSPVDDRICVDDDRRRSNYRCHGRGDYRRFSETRHMWNNGLMRAALQRLVAERPSDHAKARRFLGAGLNANIFQGSLRGKRIRQRLRLPLFPIIWFAVSPGTGPSYRSASASTFKTDFASVVRAASVAFSSFRVASRSAAASGIPNSCAQVFSVP